MTPEEKEALFLKQLAALRERYPEWAAEMDAQGDKLREIGKALAEALDRWMTRGVTGGP